MSGGEDRRALAIRICDERQIVAAARKSTRCSGAWTIDDAAMLERLSAFLEAQGALGEEADGRPAEAENVIGRALRAEADRILRDRLVTLLTDTYELRRVAAAACRRAGVEGYEAQLEYCVVVLCQKADPPRPSAAGTPVRHYRLDPGTPGFALRLDEWADEVARNLRDWSAAYRTIQDEADRYEITAVSRLIRANLPGDIATVLADKVAGALAASQRLEDMSLVLARTVEPIRSEYVFQTPLGRWVSTTAKRAAPRPTYPIDASVADKAAGDADADADAQARDDRAALFRGEVYGELVSRFLALADTRDLLAPLVELTSELERRADTVVLANADDAALLRSARAELAHAGDELRREQRSFGQMLAYVVLAMRVAEKRQRVAVLSLRSARLERSVTEDIVRRMRAVCHDPNQPTPALLSKTVGAADRGVPSSRVKELRRVRDDVVHRDRSAASFERLLEDLPATVSDTASIGAAIPGGMKPATVATTRGQIRQELKAVDEMFERGFRRYELRVG